MLLFCIFWYTLDQYWSIFFINFEKSSTFQFLFINSIFFAFNLSCHVACCAKTSLYLKNPLSFWNRLAYRLPIDTLSEYPELWLQQTRGILSMNSPNISALKKEESQTWGEMFWTKTESSHFVDSSSGKKRVHKKWGLCFFHSISPHVLDSVFFQSLNVWTILEQTSSFLLEPGFWILSKGVKRQPVQGQPWQNST